MLKSLFLRKRMLSASLRGPWTSESLCAMRRQGDCCISLLPFGESLKEYKVFSTEYQDKKGICPQWRNHIVEVRCLQASITCNLYKKAKYFLLCTEYLFFLSAKALTNAILHGNTGQPDRLPTSVMRKCRNRKNTPAAALLGLALRPDYLPPL